MLPFHVGRIINLLLNKRGRLVSNNCEQLSITSPPLPPKQEPFRVLTTGLRANELADRVQYSQIDIVLRLAMTFQIAFR